MPEDKQKINNIEELRKIHPKAFMRWTKEEDKTLLDLYDLHKTEGPESFEVFLERASIKFGRKANGVRGRLAKYFPDIAGWDYEGQKKRDEERKQKKLDSGNDNSSAQEEAVEVMDEEPVFKLDLSDNPEALEALRIMDKTRQNLFLTGEAGTGKSTLLQYFRKTTEKNVVVLAPTGVAALNVDGQTIHSFCSFGPDITTQKIKKLGPWSPKKKLLEKLDTIVIDEISMVRADLLDFVDKFLRLNGPVSTEPFGGLQMVFIGDLYQLPPVDKDFGSATALIKEYASPYFFNSRVFKSAKFEFIQLKTVYRQTDQVFIEALNGVRNNAATEQHLSLLNKRAQTGGVKFTFEKFAIYLTTTNSRARQVNNFFLDKINSDLKTYTGRASGNFEGRELPTDLNLQLKVGSQVMMLNNDRKKRWVNGTMGKIISIEKAKKEDVSSEVTSESSVEPEALTYEEINESFISESTDNIIVELETGETVEVEPHTWEMFQFVLDARSQKLDSKTTGTFTQYPFKLAWAVTIHKSQGKSFDKVYVDLSTGAFAHGQLYVALSRCRTLDGLVLKRPITVADILLDERIVKFLKNFKENSGDA